jgi:glycosyltransferase involved in cell wall biosynthesis
MGLVLLTNVLPAGLRGGGEIVTQTVVEALARTGEDVRVLGYARPGLAAAAARHEQPVGERPIETSTAPIRATGWMGRALATGAPYSSSKYYSRAYVRAARAALASGPRAVILVPAQIHFAIAAARQPLPPLVFIAYNAESEMYAEVAAGASGRAARWANARESRKIREVEYTLARQARQIWVLTERDAQYFRELCPGGDIRTLEVASMMTGSAAGRAPACDVGLIGNWTWRPNGVGLEWFAGEVVPRLPSDITIEVAGAGADWLRGRHENVMVRGVVPDAEEFMSLARVVAVPSVAGGGVQVKTLDAVACGVPVVATAVATRGLRDLPASVAVADDPAVFAEQLTRFAAAPENDRLRAEALDWSRARRLALEESVVSWIDDLAPRGARGDVALPAAPGSPPAE